MVQNSRPRINICVIGDKDQSIYGFRGSDLKYFNRFTEDFENSEIIILEKNYRSTETILEASYQVIKHQYKDDSQIRVYSDIDGHRTINVLELPNHRKEALTVGNTIEQMVGGTGFHDLDKGRIKERKYCNYRTFSDFAVLSRTRKQLRIIEKVLISKGIPCQTVMREKIFEKKYVGELLSLLKITENKGCFTDFEKILKLFQTGIGKKSSDKFKLWLYNKAFTLNEAFIKACTFPVPGIRGDIQNKLTDFIENIDILKKKTTGKAVSNKLKIIIENTPIRSAMERDDILKDIIDNMVSFAEAFNHEIGDFLSAVAMQTDIDSYEYEAEKVTLMTMHASKGLEFPVVFICGCEEGYIPYKRADEEGLIDEERRLFYVAMTRAKERLYISYARKRIIYGEDVPRRISPFLMDIEKKLKYHETPVKGAKDEPAHKQLELF
ncbi:MAG: ATP-dependent helicase [Desulfobacterales bacterium]|nr:ATP-dependent helicase [Desulfobacterales bacterium]